MANNKIKEKEIKDSKVYKDFLATRNTTLTVIDVAKKHGISRAMVYVIVEQFEKGKNKQLDKCLLSSRLDCLWEYRYRNKFNTISVARKGESAIPLFTEIFKGMREDGFSIRAIAKYTGLDRGFITKLL